MPRSKAKDKKKETKKQTAEEPTEMVLLMDHYSKGTQDNDTRRTRKNGWNAVLNAFMNKLPSDWPYNAKVVDPRVRTTILEKTARLTNGKLRGRLIPRKGASVIGARIRNAVLDFQWDMADNDGSMEEKVAKSDTTTRLLGATWGMVYWDNDKDGNDFKPWDNRDIWFDPAADHIKNARWVQAREFVTVEDLEDRGYDIKDIDFSSTPTLKRSSLYESVVKRNRDLEDRYGDDLSNPIIELVTEWVPKWASKDGKGREVAFLPKIQADKSIRDRKLPYNHGNVPFAQLRYYALGDDIYGDSEVEPVLPLNRGIQAILCGFIEEMNITMQAPIKALSGEVRIETLEYGPGAVWVVDRMDAVEQMKAGGNAVQNFNNAYPVMVAAFNTAMGDSSLGVSNALSSSEDKTATEVNTLERQQNNRDQFNQLFLGRFLKDIMLMFDANNQQFLFDDPTKKNHILKIVGKEDIRDFQKLGLGEKDISDDVMNELAEVVSQNPDIPDKDIEDLINEIALPENIVVTKGKNGEPIPTPKLDIKDVGDEADLHITKEDYEGRVDYIPDVKSMAAGAGREMERARRDALQMVTSPEMTQQFALEKQRLKATELAITVLEDAGHRDAESLFEAIEEQGPTDTAGAGAFAGAPAIGGVEQLGAEQGIPVDPQALAAAGIGAEVPPQA